MLTSMAVSQKREGMKDHYAFWETQPVAQFTDLDENMPVSLAVHQACVLPVWRAITPSSDALPRVVSSGPRTGHNSHKNTLMSHRVSGHAVHSSHLSQSAALVQAAAVLACSLQPISV